MKKRIVLIATIITAFCMLLAGCTVPFNIDNIDINGGLNKIKADDEETINSDAKDASKLHVINVTGNISIEKSSADKIQVKVKKTVYGQVDDEVKKVLEQINASVETKDGTTIIKAVTQDGQDFWQWKQKNYPMLNVNVDFMVEIPADLPDYQVTLVTGNIDIKDLNGSFAIENTTGNITLEDVTMRKSNSIDLVTGNITLTGNVKDAETLIVSNVTGNVSVSLPDDINATIKAKLTTGQIGGKLIGTEKSVIGGGSVTKTLGDGTMKIDIKNVTGNITIGKR